MSFGNVGGKLALAIEIIFKVLSIQNYMMLSRMTSHDENYTLASTLQYISIHLLCDRYKRSLKLVNLHFSQQWDVGWDRAGLCRPGWVELQVSPPPTRRLKIGGSHSATVLRTRLNLHWQALISVLATCHLSQPVLVQGGVVDGKSSRNCHPDVEESKVGRAGGLA